MMTMEAVEVTEFVRDRKDLIREVKDKVIRKKRCRRKMIRKSIGEVTPILTLQKLFLSCQAAFKGHGTVPSSNDVNNLRRILGQSNSFLFLFSSFQFWILRSLRFRGWRVFFCLKLKCLKKCLVSWCQLNVPFYWNQLYTIPKWIARNWTHFCSMRTFILYQSNFSTECFFSPLAVNRLNRFFNMNCYVKRWHFSFFTANPSSFVCVISSLLQM